MDTSNWHWRTLQTALNEQPSLSLDFYSYGVMLRKREGDTLTEYPVDPAQVAVALAARITFDTGLIGDDTLLVRQEGVTKTVVEYRRGQLTGVYLEGAADAMRVPLPPLVMVRTVRDDHQPMYAIYAVKRKPGSLDAALFHAPLPNVFNSGAICWGTVVQVSAAALAGTSLAQDWDQLLGSAFGSHAISGKSRSCPDDIRQKWLELAQTGAKRYPTSDLIPAKKTLKEVLK